VEAVWLYRIGHSVNFQTKPSNVINSIFSIESPTTMDKRNEEHAAPPPDASNIESQPRSPVLFCSFGCQSLCLALGHAAMNNNNNNEAARPRAGRRRPAAAADRRARAMVAAAVAAERRRGRAQIAAAERRARTRIAAAVRRAQAAEQGRQAAEQRNQGTYYSTIDQVWRGEARRIGVGDSHLFTVLKRRRPPSFVSHGDANYYDETIESANNAALQPFPSERSQGTTMDGDLKREVWPFTIFAIEDTVAPVAHLVPGSSRKAAGYFDVAICALALDEAGLSWETLQKAIHGAVPAGGGGRIAHTGIKHSVTNKIRLPGQGDYFDRLSCVLIVPVMTLNRAKRWDGEGYQAIVMVGPPLTNEVDPDGHPVNVQSICAAINLLNAGETARPGQIDSARTLLSHFVLGLAYSLLHRSGRFYHHMNENVRGEWNNLRTAFLQNAAAGVVVPARNRAGQPWRVRLVTFRGAAEAGNLHVAPDPYLLTVKAAVNWSRRHNQQLLAAAEPQDDDEEIDDLSALDMQRFLAVQTDAARDELARLVDQPGGLQVAF
jgi:hypothetical protein